MVGHTAYWVDFGTAHERVRDGWINEAKEMISVASELEMEFLNFHFFSGNGSAKKIPEGRKIFLNNFANSMRELSNFGKGKRITLMLENMTPYNPKTAYTIDDFDYVIRKVPSLMVHLDIAHAFVEGGNKKIDEYIKRFSKKIVHVHAHDNSGEKDEHLPIGEGKINFKKAISSLKRINYDKTVTFEVFPSNSDAKKSKEKFERLWNRA
jgi:sugar phosphate isomerase/epimerase